MELLNNVVSLKSDLIGDAVNKFIQQTLERNKNTAENYAVDIRQFFEYMYGKSYEHVTVSELNEKVDVESLMDYFTVLWKAVDENGNRIFSNNTINRKKTSIKKLLKYLKARKKYKGDLSELADITSLPKETDHIDFLNYDKAMKYAEWLRDNEKHKAQEKYLASLLSIDTGLRAEEVVSLKWNQFYYSDTEKYVTMRGVGKRNKEWLHQIGKNFYNKLLELKREGEKEVFSINYNNLSEAMKRVKKALGDEDTNISFHSLRKCAITNHYRKTGDLVSTQKFAGHASPETTMLYIEHIDYDSVGFITMQEDIKDVSFEDVSHEDLIKAIKLMRKEFQFLLNHAINTQI